jgi:hypothetical protein
MSREYTFNRYAVASWFSLGLSLLLAYMLYGRPMGIHYVGLACSLVASGVLITKAGPLRIPRR